MKRLTKRLSAALVATVALTGITTLASTPAQAAGAEARAYDPTYEGLLIAHAYMLDWFREGIRFSLFDDMADGHGVVLHINLSYDGGDTYSRWKNLYNGNGYNGDPKNFDFYYDELTTFLAFQVCRQDGINTASFHCGAWTHAIS